MSEQKPLLKKLPNIQEKPKVQIQSKEVTKEHLITNPNNFQQPPLYNLNLIQQLNNVNLYPQKALEGKPEEILLQQLKKVNLYQPVKIDPPKQDDSLLQQLKSVNLYQPKPTEDVKSEKGFKKELPKVENNQKKQISTPKSQKVEKVMIKSQNYASLEPLPPKMVSILPNEPSKIPLPFLKDLKQPIAPSTLPPLPYPTDFKKQKVNQRWTEEENKKLKELVIKYGPKNWKKIAEGIGNRHSADQCNQHWHRVVDPSIVKGDWTEEEDDLLIEKVNQLGESSWTKVAEYIDGRTDIQCRHRYFQKKRENKLKGLKPLEVKKLEENLDGTSSSVKNFVYMDSKAMNVTIEPSNDVNQPIKVKIEEIGKVNLEFISKEFPLSEAEEDLLSKETLNQKKLLDFSEILKKNVKSFHPLRKPIDLERSFYKDNIPKSEKALLFQAIDVLAEDNSDIRFASEILLSMSRIGKRKLDEIQKIKSSLDDMIEKESKKPKE